MGRASPESYSLFLVLIGVCVVVGSYFIHRLQRETAEESGVVTDDDRLKELERAYYAGGMSREEFERVRAVLTGGPIPPKPAGGAPPASPPAPPPSEGAAEA